MEGHRADTYRQIYIQVVFAVQGRPNLIKPNHKEELCQYITGIIRNQGQKVITIKGMPDHLHILIGMKPNITLYRIWCAMLKLTPRSSSMSGVG